MKSRIINADAFDALDDLDKNSVHAVVTDPPYGLAFMGRSWDDFEPKEYQEWCEKWATEVKRVLKPGGHMLAFSGNRTHHRLFTGVEDAGFEIRDTLTWHYGSGFPKASDISKTIDKRGGRVVKGVGPIIQEARKDAGLSTRELAAEFADEGQEPTGCVWNWENGASNPTVENFNKLVELLDLPLEKIQPDERDVVETSDKKEGWFTQGDGYEITKPATELSKQWDGFKTGLKPSTEFVVMARKPYDGATVDCVLEHGTGALNIDGCRIGHDEECKTISAQQAGDKVYSQAGRREETLELKPEGRYPSNLMFDEVAAEQLDADVGDLHESSKSTRGGDLYGGYESEGIKGAGESIAFGDSGGPSRYFYTSKATKAERTLDGKIDNAHPTVKPTDLMEWLVKLVTAENQIVLDPFCGSGTTCMAAKNLNRQFIGIERQDKWADVARVRVGLTPNDPSVVRGDTNQNGLESYL